MCENDQTESDQTEFERIYFHFLFQIDPNWNHSYIGNYWSLAWSVNVKKQN